MADFCPICHTKREVNVRHAHCAGCGALVGKGVVHAIDCKVKGLPRGTWCPICKRLLASGAWCPEHGNPLDHKDIKS